MAIRRKLGFFFRAAQLGFRWGEFDLGMTHAQLNSAAHDDVEPMRGCLFRSLCDWKSKMKEAIRDERRHVESRMSVEQRERAESLLSKLKSDFGLSRRGKKMPAADIFVDGAMTVYGLPLFCSTPVVGS